MDNEKENSIEDSMELMEHKAKEILLLLKGTSYDTSIIILKICEELLGSSCFLK